MNNILALETSTKLGSVAVYSDGKLTSHRESLKQRSHSETMHNLIHECLEESHLKLNQIDVFAVGQGPGSFTGIRIAGNIGKTYAYAFQKKMVVIDSLTLLANQVVNPHLPVVAMINAYKNMIYYAKFDPANNFAIIHPPQVVRIQELNQVITEDVLAIGDGFESYRPYFVESVLVHLIRPKLLAADFSEHNESEESVIDYPHARTLGKLALLRAKNDQTIEWNSFLPLYLRSSEAEENLRGIVFKPLK